MMLRRMLLVWVAVLFLVSGSEAGENSQKKKAEARNGKTQGDTVVKDGKAGDKVRDKDVAAELEMLKMMEMLEYIELLEDMDVLGKGGSR